MSLPPKLKNTGKYGRLYGWLNRLRDEVEKRTPFTSPDFMLNQMPRGFTFKRRTAGGSGSSLIALSVFEITKVALKCYALDSTGAELSSGTVYWVGKPYHLGEGRLTDDGTNNQDRFEEVDGDTEGQKRTAFYDFNGTELESLETVFPAYRAGSVIVATKAPTGLSHKEDDSTDPATALEYVDLNRDARHWRMQRVHAAVCVNDETKSQVIQGGTISD